MTTTREGTKVEVGSTVARWYDEGAGWGYTRQTLTVVRINRKSVTVQTREGSTFRMDPADLVDAWEATR